MIKIWNFRKENKNPHKTVSNKVFPFNSTLIIKGTKILVLAWLIAWYLFTLMSKVFCPLCLRYFFHENHADVQEYHPKNFRKNFDIKCKKKKLKL